MRKRIKPKRHRTKPGRTKISEPRPEGQPMTLDEILAESPDVPGYGGGQWAMYSAHCVWWTSFPADLGKVPGIGIPVCPHCSSPLFQAPLVKFVDAAREKPEHYGRHGLDTFAAAHSRNLGAARCFPSWRDVPDNGRFVIGDVT